MTVEKSVDLEECPEGPVRHTLRIEVVGMHAADKDLAECINGSLAEMANRLMSVVSGVMAGYREHAQAAHDSRLLLRLDVHVGIDPISESDLAQEEAMAEAHEHNAQSGGRLN